MLPKPQDKAWPRPGRKITEKRFEEGLKISPEKNVENNVERSEITSGKKRTEKMSGRRKKTRGVTEKNVFGNGLLCFSFFSDTQLFFSGGQLFFPAANYFFRRFFPVFFRSHLGALPGARHLFFSGGQLFFSGVIFRAWAGPGPVLRLAWLGLAGPD